MSAAVLALSAVVLVAPPAWLGILGIGGLIVTGAATVVWSQRVLTEYTRDLRAVRDGVVPDGFLRAEAASSVGLERTVGRPTERSPHFRRRRPTGSPNRNVGPERAELR